MYLDYSDYVSYGGNLEKAAFDRFSYRAERIIDAHTFSKLAGKEYEDIPTEVKHCAFELTEYIAENYVNGSVSEKSSESNDGYSVSYENKKAEEVISDTIYTYLSDTGLLYGGVSG